MKKFDRVSVPCARCTTRTLGCHDRCAAYKEYRAKLDAYNEARRLASITDHIALNIAFEAARRLHKRQKGRQK